MNDFKVLLCVSCKEEGDELKGKLSEALNEIFEGSENYKGLTITNNIGGAVRQVKASPCRHIVFASSFIQMQGICAVMNMCKDLEEYILSSVIITDKEDPFKENLINAGLENLLCVDNLNAKALYKQLKCKKIAELEKIAEKTIEEIVKEEKKKEEKSKPSLPINVIRAKNKVSNKKKEALISSLCGEDSSLFDSTDASTEKNEEISPIGGYTNAEGEYVEVKTDEDGKLINVISKDGKVVRTEKTIKDEHGNVMREEKVFFPQEKNSFVDSLAGVKQKSLFESESKDEEITDDYEFASDDLIIEENKNETIDLTPFTIPSSFITKAEEKPIKQEKDLDSLYKEYYECSNNLESTKKILEHLSKDRDKLTSQIELAKAKN